MAKFIWLASYPKSGNTWMRAFLSNYRRDGEEPVDINELDGGPIASSRSWFDNWVGLEASSLPANVTARLRPALYRLLAAAAPEDVFVKVHDAWALTDRGEPLIPADATLGAVYILRSPLDLAMSCAHHWAIGIEEAVANLCDPAHTVARGERRLPDQLPQHLGSWSGHVCSWIDDSGLPTLLVRYEDLVRDPEATFAGVVRFCGLQWDEARLRKAVAFSDFGELRRQEQAKGFRERPVAGLGPFFRRGQAGSWREELPIELARRLIEAHGETMRRFGYLDEAGDPI